MVVMKPFHILSCCALALLVAPTHGAIYSQYRADNVDNVLDGGGDGTVDDLQNTLNSPVNNLIVNSVSSSAYNFGSSWSVTGGNGGVGNANDINPFNGFGGQGTVELFIRTDLTTESGTGNDQLLFEAGAQGIGFSLGIVPNTSGADPMLRFFNNHLPSSYAISLAGLDDTDFIQVSAVINETLGGSSFVRLIARDASGTVVAGTGGFTGNNDIAGSDGMGAFSADGDGGGTSDSGGLTGGGPAFSGNFTGEIAAINIYNAAENDSTILDSYNAVVIPEPSAAMLGALSSLLLLIRRRP